MTPRRAGWWWALAVWTGVVWAGLLYLGVVAVIATCSPGAP